VGIRNHLKVLKETKVGRKWTLLKGVMRVIHGAKKDEGGRETAKVQEMVQQHNNSVTTA
jgi:hypothetical protein